MTSLDHDQITETVLRGVQIVSKILNIKTPEVYFNPYTYFSNPNVSSIYLKSRNAIVFNDKWLDSSNKLEILAMCFHESRHAYQHYSIINSSNEDINILIKWKYEFGNYFSTTNDCKDEDILYLNQSIEIDAIAFAYHLMKKFFGVDLKIPDKIKNQVLDRMYVIANVITVDDRKVKGC